MPNLSLAFDLVLILITAFLGGFLAKKLRQPLILGYIVSGFVVGVFLVSRIRDLVQIQTLAEIGVALLLFSLGIEFSISKISKVKEIAFWGAAIQLLAFIFISVIILPKFGFDFYASLFLGCCFSVSSTAVVTKILAERGEMDTLSGEVMIGWLLIQDLAVLPMLLILPQIAILDKIPFWQMPLIILKVAAILFLVFLLGRLVVPKFLNLVASINSREVLLLAVTALCLLAASGTYALGLSFALGAFLAGLIVSESTENHAVFSEIRPLRDIFSIIFFVSLGMLLTPSFIASHFLQILGLSLFVIILKFILVLVLTLYFGYHSKTAFNVGIGLVQVGEFSFVLSGMGLISGLISQENYSLVVSVTLLTIVISPFLFDFGPKFYAFLRKLSSERFPKIYDFVFTRFDRGTKTEELPFENHVVICGYGRVGSWLGRACQMAQIPFVVLDYNHQVMTDLKKQNIPFVYGDPADIDVLDYAQVDKAKILVIAIPDSHTQEMIIVNSLTLNPKIKIVCRSHYLEDAPKLKALGVSAVIMPEFEASLSIIHRLLQSFGFDKEEINNKIKRIKIEHGME